LRSERFHRRDVLRRHPYSWGSSLELKRTRQGRTDSFNRILDRFPSGPFKVVSALCARQLSSDRYASADQDELLDMSEEALQNDMTLIQSHTVLMQSLQVLLEDEA
jgi:hypothetical protein